jgi:hypothetical protein
MPSFEHNGLVDMFRENPSLALLLLEQILHLPIPEHTSVAVVEAGLDQLVPRKSRRWSCKWCRESKSRRSCKSSRR